MVKDYSVKEETPLLPHVLLFPVSCNGSFISMPIIDPLSYFLFQPVLTKAVVSCAILSVGWCV